MGPLGRDKETARGMGAGIAIGVAIGVAIDNVGAGIAIGVGLGVAFSNVQRKRAARAAQRGDAESDEDNPE